MARRHVRRRAAFATTPEPATAMGRYITRRVLWILVLMVLITFITFLIFTVLPSTDPATLKAGRNATPDRIAAIRHQLGLDDPWYQQYWIYLKRLVLHFDFGHSYTNDAEVKTLLFDRIP